MPAIGIGLGTALAGGAAAGAAVYGAHKSSSAAKTAARYQTESANRAAELEARSAQNALDFAKQQEAERKAEWQAIYGPAGLNYQMYQQQLGRLAPYRRLGAGAVQQAGEPIPGWGRRGSLSELVG